MTRSLIVCLTFLFLAIFAGIASAGFGYAAIARLLFELATLIMCIALLVEVRARRPMRACC